MRLWEELARTRSGTVIYGSLPPFEHYPPVSLTHATFSSRKAFISQLPGIENRQFISSQLRKPECEMKVSEVKLLLLEVLKKNVSSPSPALASSGWERALYARAFTMYHPHPPSNGALLVSLLSCDHFLRWIPGLQDEELTLLLTFSLLITFVTLFLNKVTFRGTQGEDFNM